jgi:signal transduction histidine kinase
MNPSFHAPANGETSENTNSEMMLENLNQSNRQLLQTIDELKDENERLRVFITIAAHELRTPIMPIVVYAEMLNEDIRERKEVKGIIYNAKRLEQLAGNILDIAKIENHMLQLHSERFNLNDMLFDIIQDYVDQQVLRGKNNVKLQYEPKDIFLDADRVRIGRVISNLLNNAIKFTANGEITITTTEIKQNDESGKIHVGIKDTGTGLSPEVLPKLFSRFVSTDSGGTGLGLFVSKNIIESHGGTIEAQNNLNGKGATFSFIIPKRTNL